MAAFFAVHARTFSPLGPLTALLRRFRTRSTYAAVPRGAVTVVELSKHPELSDKYLKLIDTLVELLKEQRAADDRQEQRTAAEEMNRNLREIADEVKRLRRETERRDHR